MFDDKGVSQKDKRAVLENDRKVMASYHSVAQSGLDDDRGGRYGSGAGSKARVTGSSPIAYPKQPANSPWHHDPMPLEPPLGFSVDEIEPTGEPHEVEASKAPTPTGEVGDGPALDGTSEVRPVIRSKLVRRM
jgi:hypothetical protein